MTEIKFVYFDIGGVLLLDFSQTNKWQELREDMGFTLDMVDEFEHIWKTHASRVCLDFDVDQLIPIYKRECKIKFPKNYTLLEDIVGRFDLNPSIWPLVSKAQNKYKLGLITDMYPGMLNLIIKRKLIPNIVWDQIIDSSVERMKKPNMEIFELAEKRSGVKPNQILFIDNLESNLEPATSRGWQTFLYNPSKPKKSTLQLAQLLNLNIN